MVGQCLYFKWVENISGFNEDYIKSYNNEIDEGYLLEVDVKYRENLHNLQNNLHFFPERMKIEQVEKLVAKLYDKGEYVLHLRNLKQPLNHGLVLKKVHRIIKPNQKAWLKPYIYMNKDLRKKVKNKFEKDF